MLAYVVDWATITYRLEIELFYNLFLSVIFLSEVALFLCCLANLLDKVTWEAPVSSRRVAGYPLIFPVTM